MRDLGSAVGRAAHSESWRAVETWRDDGKFISCPCRDRNSPDVPFEWVLVEVILEQQTSFTLWGEE